MDDLEHSMIIAENDWMRFFEESEECSLLQPSLTCPDSSSLSDSEDSGNPDSVLKRHHHEAQQSSAADREASQSNNAGYSMEEEQCTGYANQAGGQLEDFTVEVKGVTQVDCEIWLDDPGENQVGNAEQITEVTSDGMTNAQQTEPTTDKRSDEAESVSAELETRFGNVQTETGPFNLKSIQEPDPRSCNQAQLNVNVPHAAERAECMSHVTLRPEKERWFVTVNDSPLRKQVRSTSVKKKQRQKKVCKDKHMCSKEQELQAEHGSELEINQMNDESEGEADIQYFTKSDQNMLQNSRGPPSAEISSENIKREFISDSLQMHITSLPSGETNNAFQNLTMSHSLKAVIIELKMDKCEPCSSVEESEKPISLPTSTLHDTFTHKDEDSRLLDSMESDEFEDVVESFSTHSYDSENYLSVAESVEELQLLLKDHAMENQQLDLKFTSALTISNSKAFNLTKDTDDENIRNGEMNYCKNQKVNFNNIVAAVSDSEGYDEPTVTFTSAGQETNKTPEDNPTCDSATTSNMFHMPMDTPELQNHESPTECSISATDCPEEEDHLRPPSLLVPDLTITPCTVAHSPEAYAETLSPNRPVFAISAFWDEMEKLTIKDILQLRMNTNPSTTEPDNIQETVRPNVDVSDAPTCGSSLVDTVEDRLADGSLMDMSDAADSDYFTQLDESKPDRSSCEFSTFSDCEEECWQFTGASRNPSPDPQNKNQQSQKTTDFLADDSKEESTSLAGKETTVSLEQFTERRFDDHASHMLVPSDLTEPRQITKSKSVHNIQALNTEHSQEDLPLQTNAGNSLVFKVCDSLGALKAAPLLSNTDIVDEHCQLFFPEVFEYLFTDDKLQNDLISVSVYDPKDISVTPVYDYTFCAYRNEMSVSSEEKPIPIFSCSHPTVRDLTFPEVDYLFFPQHLCADSEEADKVSPVRIGTSSHLQDNDYASCEAAADGPVYKNNKHWASGWKRFSSIRKIRFYDKGSMWCQRSGGWVFPAETERIHIKRAVPAITVFSEGRGSRTSCQIFRDLAVEHSILETIQTTFSLTKREGLFATLKQSDMCLVCIAVASWVLRSTDPEAADAWKAALLANVSALSAIQYLRQYLKKDPVQDKP
ncbi:hypothetical protein LDENG_00142490 [Lucifuga dentata]|nr:hypothetical protein LDENG_00142490 [Lucifuga dentata]